MIPAGATPEHSRRAWLASTLLLAIVLTPFAGTVRAADDGTDHDRLIRLGEQIYRAGVLPDGGRLQGIIGRDVVISGADAACATCHRRSGWGASEGSVQAPPVVADVLFKPVGLGHPGAPGYRQEGPGTRPAYTPSSLARSIRDGVDSAGRRLRAPMPRFELTHDDMRALVAYLQTLGEQTDPGVDDTTVRLATVVAGPVSATRREALLGVLRSFAKDISAEVRQESTRRIRGSWIARPKYEGYRRWELIEWVLDGPPSTWPGQLERLYRREPVFAVLSGVGEGPWRPVHEFCEAKRLPCLFPVTDQPAGDASGGYTFYFSRGAALEGEAVARQLANRSGGMRTTVLQVYRTGSRGAAAAEALRQALAENPTLHVTDEAATSGPTATELSAALARAEADAVVVWLERDELAALGHVDRGSRGAKIPLIVPSWAVTAPLPEIVRSHAGPVLASFPYTLPDASQAGRDRALFWVRARHLEVTDTRVQTGAFFAASIAGDALRELRGRFSREYLMEKIEHMVDNSVTTSVYPRLSLAPGQRFAATRCGIVDLGSSDAGTPQLAEISSWIVQ